MSNIGDYRFVNFKVNCIRDNYTTRDMQIKFMYLENKTWFPAPCNGCDWLSGDKVCYECTAYLTLMFFRNPDLDITEPITPKKI